MFLDSTAFRVTAFIFVLTTAFLILIKPNLFFRPDGELKEFGLGYDNHVTIVPFSVFIYVFLIIIYGIMTLIDYKFGG